GISSTGGSFSLEDDDLDCYDRYEAQGFAAALAVLITGASQSRQHGKSESDSYYLSD
ncbi:hypothetical protein Tco_0782130, partial [Tanacetum coccineum]